MKKVTKILYIVLVLALVLTMSVVLFACNKGTPVDANTVNLKVVDYDGTVLLDKDVKVEEGKNLTTLYKENSKMESTYSEDYGTFVSSINGSYVSPATYLELTVNGKYSDKGIDSVDIVKGNKYCFEVVNSNYLADSAMSKLDKSIYVFFRDYVSEKYVTRQTVKGNGYFWLDMAIAALNNNFYNIQFNLNNNFLKDLDNLTYKDTAEAKESGSAFAKGYYALKATQKDTTAFSAVYQENLATKLYPENEGVEYLDMWMAIPGLVKGLSTEQKAKIASEAYNTDLSFGPDYGCWYNTVLMSCKGTVNKADFNYLNAKADYGNLTSTAAPLFVYAAAGIKVEEAQADLEKNTLEILADAIDPETGIILLDPSKSINDQANFSVEQIYCALVAYKLSTSAKWNGSAMVTAPFNIFAI